MDKPRHPQVIRPWKIQPLQKSRFQSPDKGDPRHPHDPRSRSQRSRFKGTGT
jgi:hypothetical protein